MSPNLKITLLGMAAATLLGVQVADARTATGDITSIDRPAGTLVLHHATYRLGKLPVASLRQGEHVRITYHWSRGHRVATRIVPIAAVAAVKPSGKVHTASAAKPKSTSGY